jgi:sRNA-binding regulator protein Hfq
MASFYLLPFAVFSPVPISDQGYYLAGFRLTSSIDSFASYSIQLGEAYGASLLL